MPTCASYNVVIPKESPICALHLELNGKYGVKDEDYDSYGYRAVNYKNPKEPPLVKGANDCEIRSEDVLEFSLSGANWEKFQDPLERHLKAPLYWSLKAGGSQKEISDRVIASVDNAKAKIDEILIKLGKIHGSDEYKKLLATAIKRYVYFPTHDVWRFLSQKSKDDIMRAMDGLKTAGLTDFIEYLVKNGGLGLYRNNRIIPTLWGTTGLESLEWEGGIGEQYLLYGIYHRAGLEPQFVENETVFETNATADSFGLRSTSDIGALIGGRVYFPDGDEKAQEKNYYPVTLRHVLSLAAYFGLMNRSFVTEKQLDIYQASGEAQRALQYGDDLTSFSCNLRIYAAAPYMDRDNKKVAALLLNVDDTSSAPPICLMYLSLAAISVGDNKLVAEYVDRLVDSDNQGVKFFGNMMSVLLSSNDTGSKVKGENEQRRRPISSFRELLARDPKNPFIMFALGSKLFDDGDLVEARKYFERVVELSPHTGLAYFNLGKISLMEGDYKSASEMLLKGVQTSPGLWANDETIYYLGYAYAMAGDIPKAVDIFGIFTAKYSSVTKLVPMGIDGIEELDKNLRDSMQKYPLTGTAAIKTGDIFMKAYSNIGNAILFFGELKKAETCLLKALGFASKSEDKKAIRSNLSAVYRLEGDAKRSEEYLGGRDGD